MTLFAKCLNPKVDYLTHGKLYEVKDSSDCWFHTLNDKGAPINLRWGDGLYATWERVEHPPQWALDKAAKALFYSGYADAQKQALDNDVLNSIRAHASTLAKYETEPVDPVLLKAKELLNDELSGNEFGLMKVTKVQAMAAIKAALRLPAMGGDQ